MIGFILLTVAFWFYPVVAFGARCRIRVPFAPVKGEPAGCISFMALFVWLTVTVAYYRLGFI